MANTIQTSPGPKTLFNWQGPSGVSPGIAGAVQFTPEGMAQGTLYKSDVWDLGSGVRNNLFEWRAKAAVAGGTVGGTVDIFFSTSDDGSLFDGNLGSGNAAVSGADKRRNLQYVGAVQVDQSGSGSVAFVSSGLVQVYARYLSVVWFDQTGQSLSSTNGDNLFQLTPVPDQIESY